jgi:hypothetical protein
MSTGVTSIAALAVPLLLAAACAGDNTDNANGTDANMPAPADSAMYAPPPAPPVMDSTMMDSTMHTDSMHTDTTRTQ